MGLGPPMMALFKFMHDQGLFSTIRSVAEIGSQEYDTKLPEYDGFLDRFFKGVGSDTPQTVDPENGRFKGPASEYFKRLGCDYVSFDIDGRFGAIPFDLNYDKVGPDRRHSATLTTNLGTTEHVVDQVACFRTIHELTAPGGYMVHALPLNNYVNHGLYSYSPAFFEALAAANDYELMGMWMTVKPHWNLLPPALKPWPPKASLLICLLRRTTDAEFVLPLQLSNPMMVQADLGARYKVTERRAEKNNWNVPVRYDGLIKVDVEAMTSTLVEDYAEILSQIMPKKPVKAAKPDKALALEKS